MRLDGRRESSNIDDRRSQRSPLRLPIRSGGLGLGAIAVIALLTWIMGGDPLSVLSGGFEAPSASSAYSTSAADDEDLALFTRQILASTEDVWASEFGKMGMAYRQPTLVMYTGAVESACGQASSAVGPFYCAADEKIYVDLDFFRQMRSQLGADGDFAHAYVIAHEVGHHVQHLLGTLDKAHTAMAQSSDRESKRISVRLELQADFLAGVWGNRENALFGSLEEGDVEEAINAASKIGDDILQQKGQGYVVPDAFTHGTASQRMRWLNRGLQTGDIWQGDTFSPRYDEL